MRELRSMRKGSKIVHSPMFMTEGGSDRSNSARNGRSYAALLPGCVRHSEGRVLRYLRPRFLSGGVLANIRSEKVPTSGMKKCQHPE